MSQYLLSVHSVDGQELPDGEDMQVMYDRVAGFNSELQSSGAWVFAGGLEPASIATVVRSAGGRVVTTDGPFSEAKEHLGGFWIIEAPDLDAALSVAERASTACQGPVEVRPFQRV